MLREWNLFVQLVGEGPVSPPLEAEGEQGEAVDALSTWSPLPPPNYDLLTRRPPSSLSLEQLCALAPPCSLPLRRRTQDGGSLPLRRKTQDAGSQTPRRTQDGGSQTLRRTQDGGSLPLRRKTQDAGSQTPRRRTQDAGSHPPNRQANDTSDPQRRLPASGSGSVKLLGSSTGGGRNEGPSTLASKLSNSAKRSVAPSEGPGGTGSGLSGRDLDRAKSDSSRFFGSTEKTEAPMQRFGGITGDRTKLHSGSVDTPRSADVPLNTDMDSSSILDDFTELDLSNFSDFDDDDNDQAETDTNLKKTTDEHVVIDLTSEEASTPPPPDSDLTVGYGSDVELFDSIPVDVVELSGQEIISAGESSNTSRGPSGPTCQYNADQGIAVGDSTVKRNSTTSASDTECIDLHDYSNIDVDLFMKDSSSSSSDSDLPRIDLSSPATHRGKQAREKTKSPWKPCPLTTHPPSSSSEPHKKQLQFAAAAVSGNQGRFTSTAISTGSSQCARETETGTLNSDTAHRSNPAVTSLQDRETTTVHTAAAGASLWGEGEESVCGRSEVAGGLGNSSCPVCGYDYPPSFTQLLADEHMAVCLSVVDTDDW